MSILGNETNGKEAREASLEFIKKCIDEKQLCVFASDDGVMLLLPNFGKEQFLDLMENLTKMYIAIEEKIGIPAEHMLEASAATLRECKKQMGITPPANFRRRNERIFEKTRYELRSKNNEAA